MVSTRLISRWMAAALLVGAALSTAAQAQVTRQTLDRVDVFNKTSVLEMAFGDAYPRAADFVTTGLPVTAVSTCKLTPAKGLYCVDSNVLKRWPDPKKPAESTELLSCADPALGFNTNSTTSCTGMTVDQAGSIWLAGPKGSTYSLIKVVAKGSAAACPAGFRDIAARTGGSFCASDYFTGRPRLGDIEPIDGDAAATFKACPTCAAQPGVIGLEERKQKGDDDDDLGKIPVFFPDAPAAVTTDLGTRQTWGISGKERLNSIAVYQMANAANSIDNYVLATTSKGRVLALNTALATVATPVFDIPSQRPLAVSGINAALCTPTTVVQFYGIRASSRTGFIYVTDRNYCQVLALLPNTTVSPFAGLVNAIDFPGIDRTLSTVDKVTLVAYPPDAATIAPGVTVNLSKCDVSCTALKDGNGQAALTLSNVTLTDTTKSGATLFQIKGIPDCRYVGKPGFPAAFNSICSKPGVVDPVGVPPAEQRLNVTPLLPKEVTGLFDNSGVPPNGLPPLWISPAYRGQQRNGYVFEAIFALTQPGTQFKDEFTGDWNIVTLEGSTAISTAFGDYCRPTLDPVSGKFATSGDALKWNLVTRVSELFPSVGGNYVNMLANSGCGTTKTIVASLSLFPYDLELSPDTYGPLYSTATKKTGTANPTLQPGNDAVFGRVLQSLHADLNETLGSYACPIYGTACASIQALATAAKATLDSCVDAAFTSRNWALVSTSTMTLTSTTAYHDDDEHHRHIAPCPVFVTQLASLRAAVFALASAPGDTANRRGELLARADVIQHVYDTRFVPSIPTTGFCREKGLGEAQCPYPWTYPTP